jgi:hypothetical protein
VPSLENGAPSFLSRREILVSPPLHLKILLITHVSLGKTKVINTWCCNPNLKSAELLQTPPNSSEEFLQTLSNKFGRVLFICPNMQRYSFSSAPIRNVITRVTRNSSNVFRGVNFNSSEHIKRVTLSASNIIEGLPIRPSNQTNPTYRI